MDYYARKCLTLRFPAPVGEGIGVGSVILGKGIEEVV